VRLASFNVENFFARPKAMNQDTWAAGRPVLAAHAELNALLEQPTYTDADKLRIVALLGTLGLTRSDSADMAVLRQVRGRLVRRPQADGVEVTADGRGDWVGWVDLTTEPVTAAAIANTARVIRDLNPQILGVVEAENRVVLKHFTDAQLRTPDPAPGGTAAHAQDVPLFPHVMLIDGNDDRGIDVALLTQDGYPLGVVRSHVDDTDAAGLVFSRDCPEYEVRIPGGHRLVVMVNHLKSKGYGSQEDNNARRLRQAQRVADIYRRLRKDGVSYVAVLGDFNDTPESAPLAPLVGGTDLRDISTHPGFDDGGIGRPGTFGTMTAAQHIDYILLSPALYAKTTGGGIWRLGAWGGVNGTLWPHYDTLTTATDAASDHAALYADLTLT
jgi:endonuclease/exonuclease/phosphatase family metal-dependent hydrolase